jgi:hypothetical protein
VSDCSASNTDFLPVGCASGTATAVEGTASRIAADADDDSGADIPEGYSA